MAIALTNSLSVAITTRITRIRTSTFWQNVVLDDGTRANLANIGKAAKEASISITEQWGLTPANHRKRMQADKNKDINIHLFVYSIGSYCNIKS